MMRCHECRYSYADCICLRTPTDNSQREPYTIIATPKSEYDALVNERDKLQKELETLKINRNYHFNNYQGVSKALEAAREQLADAKKQIEVLKRDMILAFNLYTESHDIRGALKVFNKHFPKKEGT